MLGKFKVAKIALSNASYSFDCEYSYSISKELENQVSAGSRVLVPFGRSNRRRIGFVTRTYYKEHFDPALKPVISVIDRNNFV